MQKLEKVSVHTTVDTIVNQIINSIIDGTLQPGEQIPTEVELAKQLGVGRNSIREAIKILSAYGILEIRRADGTFVQSKFSAKMLNPLLYGIILERDPIYLLEVREALDTFIHQLAVKKATDDDVTNLKTVLDRLVEELQKPAPNPQVVASLDNEFHCAIALCGHNPILEQINNVVALLLENSRLETIETMLNEGKAQFLINIHQKVYDLVLNRKDKDIPGVVQESMMHWSSHIYEKVALNSSSDESEEELLKQH